MPDLQMDPSTFFPDLSYPLKQKKEQEYQEKDHMNLERYFKKGNC